MNKVEQHHSAQCTDFILTGLCFLKYNKDVLHLPEIAFTIFAHFLFFNGKLQPDRALLLLTSDGTFPPPKYL